jgi:hypothetical protein
MFLANYSRLPGLKVGNKRNVFFTKTRTIGNKTRKRRKDLKNRFLPTREVNARRLQEDKEKRKRSQENNEKQKSLRISQGKRERLLPMRQENEKKCKIRTKK